MVDNLHSHCSIGHYFTIRVEKKPQVEILHEPVQWLKIIGVDEEEVPNLNHLKSQIIASKNIEDVFNTYGVSCDTKKMLLGTS